MGPRTDRREGGIEDAVLIEINFGKVERLILSLRREDLGTNMGIENERLGAEGESGDSLEGICTRFGGSTFEQGRTF